MDTISRKLLFASILSFALLSCFAQNGDKQTATIEVTGIAEQLYVPDEIYLEINLRERLEGRDKIGIETQEKQLKQVLQDLAIPSKNLYLSDANALYAKVRWSRKELLTRASYVLKVEKAATVAKLLARLDELKIPDARITKVDHSRMDELRKDVRVMAIKAAKDKADYLLAAIGAETGTPLIISESKPSYTRHRSMENVTIEDFGYDKLNSVNSDVQFKKISVSYAIYAKFEIK